MQPSQLKIADWETPCANGMNPKSQGWVYVKVDIYKGVCKVGYTDGALTGRLIETGNPDLVLHAAFAVPWGGNNWAHMAEQHCHNRLGRYRMSPHVMSGRTSEFFPGPVEHMTDLVARAMQEFYDELWGCLGHKEDVNALRYDPTYRPDVVSLLSDIRAPYWSRYFGLERFHAINPVPAARWP